MVTSNVLFIVWTLCDNFPTIHIYFKKCAIFVACEFSLRARNLSQCLFQSPIIGRMNQQNRLIYRWPKMFTIDVFKFVYFLLIYCTISDPFFQLRQTPSRYLMTMDLVNVSSYNSLNPSFGTVSSIWEEHDYPDVINPAAGMCYLWPYV